MLNFIIDNLVAFWSELSSLLLDGLMIGVDTEFVSDDVWADTGHIFMGPCETICVGLEKCDKFRPDVVRNIASNKNNLVWLCGIQDDLIELFGLGLVVAYRFRTGL